MSKIDLEPLAAAIMGISDLRANRLHASDMSAEYTADTLECYWMARNAYDRLAEQAGLKSFGETYEGQGIEKPTSDDPDEPF